MILLGFDSSMFRLNYDLGANMALVLTPAAGWSQLHYAYVTLDGVECHLTKKITY